MPPSSRDQRLSLPDGPTTPRKSPRSRLAPQVLLGLTVVAILVLTLRPSSGSAGSPSPTCVLCGERGMPDLLLNIVLFLPVGAALGRMGWRPIVAAGLALLFSAAIETLQLYIPGRAPTWRDVIMNATGAGLGALVARELAHWLRWSRLGMAAGVAALIPGLAVAVTGLLLQPSVRPSQWYGQLAPRLAHLEPWAGRIDSARVGTSRLPHGYLRNSAEFQAAIMARAPVVIHAVAGTAPERLAAIVGITDDGFEEMLLIGQEGSDLVVRERRRAADLRLFDPEFRFVGALRALTPGRPFVLEVLLSQTAACALVDAERSCAAPLAASSAWSFLIWRRWWTPAWQRGLGALTMASLFLPLGLLLAGTEHAAAPGSERRILAWQTLAMAVACALPMVAASMMTLAPIAGLDWMGGIAGVGAGATLRRLLRPLDEAA